MGGTQLNVALNIEIYLVFSKFIQDAIQISRHSIYFSIRSWLYPVLKRDCLKFKQFKWSGQGYSVSLCFEFILEHDTLQFPCIPWCLSISVLNQESTQHGIKYTRTLCTEKWKHQMLDVKCKTCQKESYKSYLFKKF